MTDNMDRCVKCGKPIGKTTLRMNEDDGLYHIGCYYENG